MCRIDKWSGLILNDQSSMPRGYVFDKFPELIFGKFGMYSISHMEKNNEDFKLKRTQMELHLNQVSDKIKKMTSFDKKRKLSAIWNESKLRRL